jgi:hypothetical protein
MHEKKEPKSCDLTVSYIIVIRNSPQRPSSRLCSSWEKVCRKSIFNIDIKCNFYRPTSNYLNVFFHLYANYNWHFTLLLIHYLLLLFIIHIWSHFQLWQWVISERKAKQQPLPHQHNLLLMFKVLAGQVPPQDQPTDSDWHESCKRIMKLLLIILNFSSIF